MPALIFLCYKFEFNAKTTVSVQETCKRESMGKQASKAALEGSNA